MAVDPQEENSDACDRDATPSRQPVGESAQPEPRPIREDLEADLPDDEREALDSFNWAWNEQHQAALDALHAGDTVQAIGLAREAVRAAQAGSVDDAPISLDLLATACMAAGEWSEADETLLLLLSKGFAIYGKDNPVVGAWLVMLGEANLRQGDPATAESFLREGLRTFACSLADDSAIYDALDTHDARVLALSMTIGADKASEHATSARQPEWPTHPAAVRVLFLLATSLNLQRKYQESVRYCNAVINVVDLLRSVGWQNDKADYCRQQAESTKQFATQQQQQNISDAQ